MIGIVAALTATCLFLFILWMDARSKASRINYRYVDTSGIMENPPRFIDTWKNKTINFDLGKHSLKINHLPILENIDVISRIAGHFAVIKHGVESAYNAPFSKTDKIRVYQTHYMRLIALLYKLGKPHSKRGFKNAFYKRAKNDFNFILGVSEQIFDYWQNMGKLLGVLSQGLTPLLVYGETLGSGRLKWDDQGKRLITPRYDFIPKSKLREMKEKEKKTKE